MAENKSEERRQTNAERIAAEIVPAGATGALALRAVAIEAINRHVAQKVTFESASEADREYVSRQEQNVRDATKRTAERFRRLADDLDLAAEREPVDNLPSEVAQLVATGIFNANIDGAARWYRDLTILRQAFADGRI